MHPKSLDASLAWACPPKASVCWPALRHLLTWGPGDRGAVPGTPGRRGVGRTTCSLQGNVDGVYSLPRENQTEEGAAWRSQLLAVLPDPPPASGSGPGQAGRENRRDTPALHPPLFKYVIAQEALLLRQSWLGVVVDTSVGLVHHGGQGSDVGHHVRPFHWSILGVGKRPLGGRVDSKSGTGPWPQSCV